MQHHPGQRPARPLAPMRAARRGACQQAARLQKHLGPGVAPAEAVIAHQMLVEMLRREAAVAGAIQRLDLRLPLARHPLARRLAETPVQQAGLAGVLKPDAPTPERPLADAKQRRRIDLVELTGFMTLEHAPELDQPHTL